ncbi:MAG: imelysin family protein [Flavobacteriales bacterium]
MKHNALLAFAIAVALSSCKKDDPEPAPIPAGDLQREILNQFGGQIAEDLYTDLAAQTVALQTSINALQGSLAQSDLDASRTAWRIARHTWEQSEAHLFGPVSTANYDPRMDTWPVNYVDLEAILNNGDVLDEAYVSALEDALKGFHAIEFLLWGADGNKVPAEFTAREFEFLSALTADLNSLTGALAESWDPNVSGNFQAEFETAGAGSATYTTKLAAYEELVNAMAGICEEVAGGKISEPFLAQDPSLEESPFAQNSLIDFTNNIRGVENVYLGRFNSNGAGIEDLVREHDLQLDGAIKTRIAAAIQALDNISVPFGEAIISEPVQVQNAIDAINDLESILSNELMALVQLHITD